MDNSPETLDARSKLANTRFIKQLPYPPLSDYTPYTSLEFDPATQEYCQNKSHHQKFQAATKPDNISKKCPTPQLEKYNSINSPTSFDRNVRTCKVIVSGDVAVGKTCLVNRFGHDIYANNYQTTIGVDFDIQKFNILGQSYLLQIWDTAGLERFKCITSSYYRGCQAALLVFDISNLSTLANVLRWKDEVLSSSKTYDQLLNDGHSDASQQTPVLFLVGTKSDLPLADSTKQFIRDQANKLARLLEAELWFVSAQTGENVKELFYRVAAVTFNRRISSEIQQAKFEASTLGACIKEKLFLQQKELWHKSSKFIKITKKRDGYENRSRCVNIQCVIK